MKADQLEMPKIIWRPGAEHNLKSIAFYIANDNPKRAVSFARELEKIGNSLGDLPKRDVAIPRLGTNVHRLVHGNYLIFYRYDENQNTVFILRATKSHLDHSRIKFED